MFILNSSNIFKNSFIICNSKLFLISRQLNETHYETLNLRQDCSKKQIKEAFIKLSKEYHPDKNGSKSSEKFLKINEAYKILSKPEDRKAYDLGLSNPNYSQKNYYTHIYKDPFDDPLFYKNQTKSNVDEHYKVKPYYGVKGVNRVSNLKIALFCIFLTFLGVCLQIFAINKSSTFRRENILKKSQEAQENLNNTRKTALLNGNNKQLELLQLKLTTKKDNR